VLPNNIAMYRKAAGLTQEALASAIGTSRSMLVKLERDERPLTGDWLEKIGDAVGIAPHLLIAPPGALPNEDELAEMIASAQQTLPAGLPYSEWPRAVASGLHMRLRTLVSDRASVDIAG
jgi:transcriptional regulator with XRE-family HTH domain